ncbi:hypothetical protein BDA96_03G208700 [Sorghum bicolor]|uniref:Uncharacterized protein n=2 Tax=Sorghum bicolor TaxID=4558 RepID=A0A921RE47_SORBI|nr:hypothetical protein BDA96_03G208700 [Sorghum bicolor]KXG32743.1 hypothetical protein SORBI_3003G192300 [Sorghum bicolor]
MEGNDFDGSVLARRCRRTAQNPTQLCATEKRNGPTSSSPRSQPRRPPPAVTAISCRRRPNSLSLIPHTTAGPVEASRPSRISLYPSAAICPTMLLHLNS